MPKRGEVWAVNLDPAVGDEIKKTRPVVVVGSDFIKGLENKIVVPIREWHDYFGKLYWMIKINPSKSNGLEKESAADANQIKSISIKRFEKKVGRLADSTLDDIVAAVALCIEYE